jgi:mannose-6-phosphate isomerase-like protein (cupin superfamily)
MTRFAHVSHWRHAPDVQAGTGHRHREQEEAYVVVAGSGRMLIDGEVIELRQWDVVRVAPEGGDGEPVPVTWP